MEHRINNKLHRLSLHDSTIEDIKRFEAEGLIHFDWAKLALISK